MPIAPQGMTQVHLAESATAANDAAIGVALYHYAVRHKRDYKNLTVMGLTNASHGDSISTMSCSDPCFRQGVPTYSWPLAPLPVMKQPFIEHANEYAAEE